MPKVSASRTGGSSKQHTTFGKSTDVEKQSYTYYEHLPLPLLPRVKPSISNMKNQTAKKNDHNSFSDYKENAKHRKSDALGTNIIQVNIEEEIELKLSESNTNFVFTVLSSCGPVECQNIKSRNDAYTAFLGKKQSHLIYQTGDSQTINYESRDASVLFNSPAMVSTQTQASVSTMPRPVPHDTEVISSKLKEISKLTSDYMSMPGCLFETTYYPAYLAINFDPSWTKDETEKEKHIVKPLQQRAKQKPESGRQMLQHDNSSKLSVTKSKSKFKGTNKKYRIEAERQNAVDEAFNQLLLKCYEGNNAQPPVYKNLIDKKAIVMENVCVANVMADNITQYRVKPKYSTILNEESPLLNEKISKPKSSIKDAPNFKDHLAEAKTSLTPLFSLKLEKQKTRCEEQVCFSFCKIDPDVVALARVGGADSEVVFCRFTNPSITCDKTIHIDRMHLSVVKFNSLHMLACGFVSGALKMYNCALKRWTHTSLLLTEEETKQAPKTRILAIEWVGFTNEVITLSLDEVMVVWTVKETLNPKILVDFRRLKEDNFHSTSLNFSLQCYTVEKSYSYVVAWGKFVWLCSESSMVKFTVHEDVVLKVCRSQILPELVLSSSIDGTIRIYDLSKSKELFSDKCMSTGEYFSAISWNHRVGYQFVAATNKGRVVLYDLLLSKVPVTVYKFQNCAPITQVEYCPDAQAIVVGFATQGPTLLAINHASDVKVYGKEEQEVILRNLLLDEKEQ